MRELAALATPLQQKGGVRIPAKFLGAGFALLVIAALLTLLAWGMLNKVPVTGKSGITRVQRPAPEFRLALFNGGELALSERFGRPIVINFWASWCPPCRDEARILEGLWRQHQADEVLIIGIDIQDAVSDAKAFLGEFDITYPNGLDEDGRITIDYGVIGLPVTFFVGRNGIIERRWVGAIGGDDAARWIDDLVAGTPSSTDRDGENPDEFFFLEGDR